MLALLPLLLLAPTQSSNVMELVLRESGPVPGFAPSAEIRDIVWISSGRGGGWVSEVRVFDPSATPDSFSVVVGQRPGQADGPVELLRQPVVLQGLTQTSLFRPSMADGMVAYVDSQYAPHRVWIEDQFITETGDTISGTAGWRWQTFIQVELTTSGDMLIYGIATVPGSSNRELVWRWPQGQALLWEGRSLPGFGTVSRFDSGLSLSPNGEHWSMVVRKGSGLNLGVVVDGQILEATPGRPVMVGAAVPPDIAGSHGPSLWDLFQFPARLNDRGDYAVEGQIRTIGGTQHSVIARNGRVFLDGEHADMTGIDARGAILYAAGGELLIEEQAIATWPFELDVDGDGVADPAFGVCSISPYSVAQPNSDSQTLFRDRIRENNSCVQADYIIVRPRPMRLDLPVCEGVANSTGFPGQLVIGGSSQVAENEASLQLFGLPEGAPCYAILSRSAGFVANPAGSQGNLCLSGGIGRMVLSLFVANVEGRGQVALDLTALREPGGYVAALPGERWFFQAWYRDSVAGMATSNFTSASALLLD